MPGLQAYFTPRRCVFSTSGMGGGAAFEMTCAFGSRLCFFDLNNMRIRLASLLFVVFLTSCSSALGETNYEAAASQVTDQIQTTFYLPSEGLYAQSLAHRDPEFMWGNGVMFTALLGACRHNPEIYAPIASRFFKAMDA